MKIKINGVTPAQAIAIVIGLALISALIVGLVVMLLWNWLMPQIFSLQTINYAQAFGIFLLCFLLFQGTNVIKSN